MSALTAMFRAEIAFARERGSGKLDTIVIEIATLEDLLDALEAE